MDYYRVRKRYELIFRRRKPYHPTATIRIPDKYIAMLWPRLWPNVHFARHVRRHAMRGVWYQFCETTDVCYSRFVDLVSLPQGKWQREVVLAVDAFEEPTQTLTMTSGQDSRRFLTTRQDRQANNTRRTKANYTKHQRKRKEARNLHEVLPSCLLPRGFPEDYHLLGLEGVPWKVIQKPRHATTFKDGEGKPTWRSEKVGAGFVPNREQKKRKEPSSRWTWIEENPGEQLGMTGFEESLISDQTMWTRQEILQYVVDSNLQDSQNAILSVIR